MRDKTVKKMVMLLKTDVDHVISAIEKLKTDIEKQKKEIKKLKESD